MDSKSQIHRVHFMDYNKMWCLISFPLWMAFSSLFFQTILFRFNRFPLHNFFFLWRHQFLSMHKRDKLPTNHIERALAMVNHSWNSLSLCVLFSRIDTDHRICVWNLMRLADLRMFVQINNSMYATQKQYYIFNFLIYFRNFSPREKWPSFSVYIW